MLVVCDLWLCKITKKQAGAVKEGGRALDWLNFGELVQTGKLGDYPGRVVGFPSPGALSLSAFPPLVPCLFSKACPEGCTFL